MIFSWHFQRWVFWQHWCFGLLKTNSHSKSVGTWEKFIFPQSVENPNIAFSFMLLHLILALLLTTEYWAGLLGRIWNEIKCNDKCLGANTFLKVLSSLCGWFFVCSHAWPREIKTQGLNSWTVWEDQKLSFHLKEKETQTNPPKSPFFLHQ